MSFSDEARELARKRQAEQQMRKPETSEEAFIRRMTWVMQKEFEERMLPPCVDRLTQWFDNVGMLPHPPLDSGERKYRPSQHFNWNTDRYEPSEVSYVEITWRFDGYGYRASCSPASPASSSALEVEINVGDKWFQANTKEAIGWALLQEG
jgi:hypothetical protein